MKRGVLAFLLFTALSSFAQNDIAVLGMVQVTRDSTGYGYGVYQTQSSPISPGFSVEYRHWWAREGKWHDNGLLIAYSFANSGAGFHSSVGSINFELQRKIFDVGYVKRFQSDSFLAPYVMAGAGGSITDGGRVPGGVLGVDGQFDLLGEVGADARVGRHFGMRWALASHWFRAPNFSDTGYHASRTAMLEPKIGMTWRF
jgi:hypothetical protein